MPTVDAIRWFKTQFQNPIQDAVKGTPFTVDMLTGIACQETGYVWNKLRQHLDTTAEILELCVGDIIDSSGGRKAFPRNKTHLLTAPRGDEMFEIAREGFVQMAQHITSYKKYVKYKTKFCRGYGIFQYDLQFYLKDPDYFLEKRYANFYECLDRAIGELKDCLRKNGWEDRESLTEYEMACVAIAYNTGRYRPNKGLKQGHKSGGVYYGEAVFEYIRRSKAVQLNVPREMIALPVGEALTASPTPVTATGKLLEVQVLSSMLNVREEPVITPPGASSNVIAKLPDGQLVRCVTSEKTNGFHEIETNLSGAHISGFAFAKYLVDPSADSEIEVPMPSAHSPTKGIVAVYMPRSPGSVTKRSRNANAHSLNETAQPDRQGASASELRQNIADIIDWLAVDKASHARYQPRSKLTFCNIYAHDFCHLAGCYLPRVWWTQSAIARLASGDTVRPLYEKTIEELRANDLLRWLRDFGLSFGWRRTGSLSKLQLEANQGAIGLIVARRTNDTRSGHIVLVVPETEQHRARRDAQGNVTIPLQSQAGSRNFQYGTPSSAWWRQSKFAEHAYWLHA